MDFVAVDVETANPRMASICQIGVVRCRGGELCDEWKTLVDPEDEFSGMNVAIHGIDAASVDGAPTFAEVANELFSLIDGEVAVCHTHFDRVALHQAAVRYGLQPPAARWLDSSRIARRAWAQCSRSGYGLQSVCEMLGFEFQHHDALEDAKAAAHIVLAAERDHALGLAGWLTRILEPIEASAAAERAARPRTHPGNPTGPLFGEVVVFTGALGISRQDAIELAGHLGCRVASGVTKKTTMLVVGDQDLSKLAGHEKSAKHRKAEALVANGLPIRIVGESDFQDMVRIAQNDATD